MATGPFEATAEPTAHPPPLRWRRRTLCGGTFYRGRRLVIWTLKRLQCGNERMADSVDGQCDAVLDTHLVHQFRHMCLDRSFFDSQGISDLLVGPAFYQHFQDLLLPGCESETASLTLTAKHPRWTFDDHRRD